MLMLRSLLFVPGNKENMLARALALEAVPDAIVPDMEDSVPAAEKSAARATIAAMLPRLAERGVPVIPRVNSLETGWTDDDLAAVVGPHVLGVSIGKIRTPAEISRVSSAIARLEASAGLEVGRLKLLPWIETAAAIVALPEICRASNRIVAIAFGGEDFTHDMGIER